MEQLVFAIFEYLVLVGLATAAQLLILVGPGLFLAFLIHRLSLSLQKQSVRLFGKTAYLVLFGWLGIMIHELGHALFSVLSSHRIVAIKLFELDPEDGTYGYVRHEYNSQDVYQVVGNFFIGVGPILLGTAVIYLTARWLLGPDVAATLRFARVDVRAFGSLETLELLMQSILLCATSLVGLLFNPALLGRWEFFLFIYLTLSVSSALALSPSDLAGALSGAQVFVLILLVLNFFTLWLGNFLQQFFFLLAEILAGFYGIMVFALLLSGLFALFLAPFSFFLGARRP